MPTLIALYMAGWDCSLIDASLLRCRSHWFHHPNNRNLTIEEAPMVHTSDCSGPSSLGGGGT